MNNDELKKRIHEQLYGNVRDVFWYKTHSIMETTFKNTRQSIGQNNINGVYSEVFLPVNASYTSIRSKLQNYHLY